MTLPSFSRGPRGRWRRPRVLRPGMARVAAAQLLSDFLIRRVPETAQIAGGLNGTAVGREQLEDNRLPARTQLRRFREAEQLLKLHGRDHGAVFLVLEPCRPAARDGEGVRREAIEIAPASARAAAGQARGFARATARQALQSRAKIDLVERAPPCSGGRDELDGIDIQVRE